MLKIAFAGTPDFAANILADLINSEHKVVGVYTQPDRPKGRGRQLQASPVKALALEHRLPVYQPQSLHNADTQATLTNLQADILIVVAYGLILPQAVLDIPTHGCLNIHASLLPRWRGAAPIQHAILQGDEYTGVTIMQMNAGLDTGDMLQKRKYRLTAEDTLQTIENTLAVLGSQALLETLSLCEQNKLQPEKQDEQLANYAHKITKTDTLLHWHHSAIDLDRRVRAFIPRPIAHTLLNDQLIKIHQTAVMNKDAGKTPGTIIAANKQGIDVATKSGVLRLLRLQLPGGNMLTAAEMLNAKASLFVPGKQFTS